MKFMIKMYRGFLGTNWVHLLDFWVLFGIIQGLFMTMKDKINLWETP